MKENNIQALSLLLSWRNWSDLPNLKYCPADNTGIDLWGKANIAKF